MDLRPLVEDKPSEQGVRPQIPIDTPQQIPAGPAQEAEIQPDVSMPPISESAAATTTATTGWQRARQTKTPAKLEPYILY